MTGEDRSWRLLLVFAACWLILLFLLLPLFVIVPISLTPTRYVSIPALDELSLNPYRTVFGSHEWLASILQSIIIGTLASAFALVIGTLSAIGLWRIGPGAVQNLRWLALSPLIVPPVVSALAFYRLMVDFGNLFGVQLLDSYAGMVIAHGILGVPFVVIPVSTALANLDLRIEQAARGLGATAWQTLFLVILPNIKSGLVAGAIFAFVLSWDEIVVTLFIAGRKIYTVPMQMWAGVRENLDPAVAAVATIFIALTAIAIVSLVALRKA